jgi:hypothetical protein
VGHTSRSSGLLHLEASRARISQSSLKTGGGVTRMVHVASSRRSRGDEVEDERVDATGCIELFYPNFAVFTVLGPRGISVRKCAIVRCSCRATTPSKSRVEISVRGEGFDTPGVVEQCLTMYCRSLNEILDLFSCITSAVQFEFQFKLISYF